MRRQLRNPRSAVPLSDPVGMMLAPVGVLAYPDGGSAGAAEECDEIDFEEGLEAVSVWIDEKVGLRALSILRAVICSK